MPPEIERPYDLPVRALGIIVVAGCSGAAVHGPADDAPGAVQPERIRHYTIWMRGARIGSATETETWSALGVRLQRDEDLRFARGEAVVQLHARVVVDADLGLQPARVTWSERGETPRSETAFRDGAGWHVSTGAAVPADAIPGELAELVVRRDGRFVGDVFLPARGFAAGSGRIEPVAPGRFVARLTLAGDARAESTIGPGPASLATIDVGSDGDGLPARVVDGDGVIELRATADEAAAPFAIVDLIAATALPITGARHSHALAVDTDLTLPALPGQLARPGDAAAPDTVDLQLDASLPGALPAGEPGADRAGDIAALVDAVRARVAPDLAAGPARPDDAAAATAGDCTTFALAYTSLASRAGIATRVVTGFRVDGDRLVRHRWAVSWTGRAWIAVDAAFDSVPAGGDLVGLAVTDASDAGLVAGDAALAHVRAARWR